MAGIGCDGYDIKIPELIKHFKVDKSKYPNGFSKGWSNFIAGGVDSKDIFKDGYIELNCFKKRGMDCFRIPATKANKKRFESVYIGIKSSTYKEFIKWLAEQVIVSEYVELQDWYKKVKKIKWQDAINYNQGDAFFADKNIIQKDIGSHVGKATTPAIIKMIDKINKKG